VTVCSSCGVDNPDGFRFCGNCAAPLSAPIAHELRKTVTVVFCDVTGSTALGERLDPESLRRVLLRYFERMKEAVESHGGTVEKFVGDAVMAVFGVPRVHEDDALRAVRAAAQMRENFVALNQELASSYGTQLEARIGVNTGEVVTGTEERLATGDAVNVAARLEQAAQPGEVLLGEQTVRLARAWIVAEPVELLKLKGKREPVPAWRLVSVSPEVGVSRSRSPLVGRKQELLTLERAWKRACGERKCELVTVLGVAGVGKSRLVAEALERIDASVVRARCLPYGEGITYWPVVEVLKQLESRRAALGLDRAVSATLDGLLDGKAGSTDEIAWAFRKLLESVGEDSPLVAVFDDIQWGEEVFLDLLEHLAYLAAESPIFLVCMGRPELLDRRPGWGGGVLRLEPLAADETERLIDLRLCEQEVKSGVRKRIAAASGGNPLFVEEMAAMLLESGNSSIDVPPTIHALLEARLDQLEPAERAVLERAAVEGEIFHRGAVHALTRDESRLTMRLTSLVRKGLIRPDRSQVDGEDAFRFGHLLIRDVAYGALPKVERAELHERFSLWLEADGRALTELDEISGYHLEQAHKYRLELAPLDDHGRELARRAAERLRSAGTRALRRSDAPAAVNLLSRGLALLAPDDEVQLELLPDLGEALIQAGELTNANAVLADAIDAARTFGDRRVEWRAVIERTALETLTDPEHQPTERVRRTVERAVAELEQLADDGGLARALTVLADEQPGILDGRPMLERALEHARRAGDEQLQAEIMVHIGVAVFFGPTHAEDVIRHLEGDLEWYMARGLRRSEAGALAGLAHAQAMRCRFDEARCLLARHRSIVEDLGQRHLGGVFAWASAQVETLAGDPAAVERELRPAYESLANMGERVRLPQWAAARGQAALDQGHLEEAETWAETAEKAAVGTASSQRPALPALRARILARRGECAEATRLAREAVALAEADPGFIDDHGFQLMNLADVLRSCGHVDEAATALKAALELFERKGNLAAAAMGRASLDKLRQGVGAEP
jgi:class 3 adenylate cyclase/tetratricopeptide (TPR) repeat protein